MSCFSTASKPRRFASTAANESRGGGSAIVEYGDKTAWLQPVNGNKTKTNLRCGFVPMKAPFRKRTGEVRFLRCTASADNFVKVPDTSGISMAKVCRKESGL